MSLTIREEELIHVFLDSNEEEVQEKCIIDLINYHADDIDDVINSLIDYSNKIMSNYEKIEMLRREIYHYNNISKLLKKYGSE